MSQQSVFASALVGKVAIITGGASGIGHAVAKTFLAQGAKVALFDMHKDVENVAKQLSPTNAMGVMVDITSSQAAAAAVDSVLKKFNTIDVLVNNAGVARLAPAEDQTEKDWDLTIAVNLKAPFILAQLVGRHMIKKKSGSIVNIASQAGVIAIQDHVSYTTSKAGIIGLTKVLAFEWGIHNIRVNAVSPTVVMTDLGRAAWNNPKGDAHKAQIPMRRFAEPEEVANAVLFLASDASSMTTGANLMVDGGFVIG